jgi:hypothetical protein
MRRRSRYCGVGVAHWFFCGRRAIASGSAQGMALLRRTIGWQRLIENGIGAALIGKRRRRNCTRSSKRVLSAILVRL